ncbi:hypothetical protein EI545_02325 [Tabrizicola piscis]|uniref:Uncharacterized protein n=1 Tax=Tabrizicola piscis TaxID=2494374 RepID=A0A3S8U2D9_9RHOB|nr:hypothetical protein [Tabrizicola piscis]AZL57780.1 hypothetical protein EI545_02325 [Tabrizicola piscis]
MVRAPTKTCPNLHRVLVEAPLDLLARFMEGKPFQRSDWLANYRFATDHPDGRDRALRMLDHELKSTLLPLETEATRIANIAGPRGQFALEGLLHDQDDGVHTAAFLTHHDELARSLWAWLDATPLFEAAENVLHLRLYRRYEKHYQTFQAAPVSDDERHVGGKSLEEFLQDLEQGLKRGSGCRTERYDIPAEDGEPQAEMYIIRHPNLPTAAREIDDDGTVSKFYFRPPGEAMVVFVPSTGLLHVRADTRAIRHLVWKSFVTKVLVQDLSHQPVDFRAYDISRFLTDLDLCTPEDGEALIKEVWLIRVDASIRTLGNRIALSTTIGQNVRNLIDSQPGLEKVFTNAVAVRFVEIAVRYRRSGHREDQTLTFTISDGNTCSLMSVADTFEQALGHRLLRAWGILAVGRAPTDADLRTVLPAAFTLWDTGAEKVTGAWLIERNIDADKLQDLGFLAPYGWDDVDLIEDENGMGVQAAVVDAGSNMVELGAAPGQMAPVVQASRYRLYRVRPDWVEQYLKQNACKQFRSKKVEVINPNMLALGSLEVDGAQIPVYLARRLMDEKCYAEVDTALRSRSNLGIGLVLNAGRRAGFTLAANVLVSVVDNLVETPVDEVEALVFDTENLRAAFLRHRNLAQGGETVELVMTGGSTAILQVPGRGTISIEGENRLLVLGRLVGAFKKAGGSMKTENMLAGIEGQSLSNIFGADLWNKLKSGFLHSPKRGQWQIAS